MNIYYMIAINVQKYNTVANSLLFKLLKKERTMREVIGDQKIIERKTALSKDERKLAR